LIEEEYHFNGIREIFSISSMKSIKSVFNQRRLEAEVLRCDIQTFQNNSAIGEQCPAAETDIISPKHSVRQRHVTECTKDSVCFKTCLESEINPMLLIGEFSKESFITSSKISPNSTSFYYQNRSFKESLHHPSSDDHQIMKSLFMGVGKLIQSEKQKLELQFSKEELFYTRTRIFGINSSFKFQSDLCALKPYNHSRRDQVKSSKLNIEHPLELACQWNPSSSEDR
jgi:hypothetical protein